MAIQTWGNSVILARQTSGFGNPVTTYTNYHLNGTYFHLPVQGDLSVNYDFPKILPEPQTGLRYQYQYPVESGRTEIEVQATLLVTLDTLPLLLYAALGSLVATNTADAGNPTDTIADLTSPPATLTGPTAQGFLRFTFTGVTGTSPTLTISGTDANGVAVSEVLPIPTGGSTVYTRRSYDGTATISTAWSGFTAGSASVDVFTQTSHAISGANTNPLWTIVSLGGLAIDSTSEAERYDDAILTSMVINFDAEALDGMFEVQCTFRAGPSTVITAPTAVYPTVDRPVAGWRLGITKGGSSFTPVQSGSITINTGLRHYRAAVNSQAPQGVSYGARNAMFNLVLVQENDDTYDDYIANTEWALVFTVSHSGDKVASAVNKSLTLTVPRFAHSSISRQDDDGLQGITLEGVSIGDFTATVVNAVYGY